MTSLLGAHAFGKRLLGQTGSGAGADQCRVDGGLGSVLGLRRGGRPGREIRSAEREQDSMMSLPPGPCPGGDTVRLDRVGSAPGLRQGGTLGQRARSGEREHNEMPSLPPGAGPGGETVRLDRVNAGVGPVPRLRRDGKLGQGAWSAERELDDMPSLPPGACPGGWTVRRGGGWVGRRGLRRDCGVNSSRCRTPPSPILGPLLGPSPQRGRGEKGAWVRSPLGAARVTEDIPRDMTLSWQADDLG
jgi:hypothetical protein